MRPDGRCTSCGARIRWAIVDGTATLMPLDPVAREDGNIGVVDWAPKVRGLSRPIVQVNPGRPITPYRYATHFATCPKADEHRHQRITGGHA